jgi:membrane-associated phospholipid phosphatase
MHVSERAGPLAVLVALALSASQAEAQTPTNLAVLSGLAPVSALETTAPGKSALAANLSVTGAIQQGSAHQPNLLPFAAQQQQALRDAFITDGNASELTDGLGSTLGGVYQASAKYTSTDDGNTSHFTNISPAIAQLIAYANATSHADADAGKFFFANATLDGKRPVSPAALAILKEINGTTDIFGKAYGFPAGGNGADPYGDSRPFQTEPRFVSFEGQDFFGVPSGNLSYLRGPAQDLTKSPSYPSGHTTYGYMESLLVAILVPERYPQMVARAAEYGNDRILMGAHYTMDVLGGRTLSTYDLAQLLANKPGYVGTTRQGVVIEDFRKALVAARADLDKALEAGCGSALAACAQRDHGRFANPSKNRTFYEVTQTYGLPTVYAQRAADTEDVAKLAPEAGYLLTVAFPYLTLAEADAILTSTEGPGGGFLDNGSAFGVYSRLDLDRAAEKAIAAAPRAERHAAR